MLITIANHCQHDFAVLRMFTDKVSALGLRVTPLQMLLHHANKPCIESYCLEQIHYYIMNVLLDMTKSLSLRGHPSLLVMIKVTSGCKW